MRCHVVTGASRGLGLALAGQILASGSHLVAVARTESPGLRELGSRHAGYRFTALDLADSAALGAAADELFGTLAAIQWQGVHLINNAGTVEPIGPAGSYADDDAVRALAINLTAPILLSNAFIRHFSGRPGDRRIMNISSGAGRNAYEGWSIYCAGKAGLDRYSEAVGLEQMHAVDAIRIAAVAPGVIDTGMQASIRETPESSFPMLQRFVDLKQTGGLTPPAVAAAALLDLLHSERYGYGDLLDIRNPRP